MAGIDHCSCPWEDKKYSRSSALVLCLGTAVVVPCLNSSSAVWEWAPKLPLSWWCNRHRETHRMRMEMAYISEKWKIPGGNTWLQGNVNVCLLHGTKHHWKPQNYAFFVSSPPILDFTVSGSLTRKFGSLRSVNWACKEARERSGVPAGEPVKRGLVQSQDYELLTNSPHLAH